MGHILVACPQCKRAYKVPSDRVGHKVKCACGHGWTIEPPVAPAAAAPPAPEVAEPAPAAPPAEPAGPAPIKPEPVKPQLVQAGAAAGALAAAAAAAREPQDRAQEDARKLVGRELGNFRIDDLLGVGGFGAVYKAFDKSLHRHVALKVLPASVARAGKEKIQQFLMEARAAAKLSHPNIVTVHQICEAERIYFIVMELVEGRSLADLVQSRRLSPQQATRTITEAARGLAHAHKRGLIHRDIKPGNIMVTADGQVKMTDFGLARDIFREVSEEEEGRAVGTPLYMAPEQCEGEEGDSRSDVYSMGATYYVALTRRPPYEGRTTEEVMNQHRFSPPPDPRTVIPSLPPAVYRIIEKAMAKDSDERYQTAEEFLRALEGLDFATLDPNASLSLETVTAQIGDITPQVGEHVGAVIKQAARKVDRSTNGSRLVDTIEKASPMKWYILAGALVLLICLVAVVGAIILAVSRQRTEPPTPPYSAVAVLPAPTSDQPATTAVAVPSVPHGGQPAATTDVRPSPGTDEQPEPAEQPAPPRTPEQERIENARIKYEEAKAWEEKAWTTNPMSVLDAYRAVIDVYPDTPGAAEAKKAIDRLTAPDKPRTEEPPPAPEPVEPPAAPDPAQPAE